jgi:diguanylate cyclase (GGDEF)-like protein
VVARLRRWRRGPPPPGEPLGAGPDASPRRLAGDLDGLLVRLAAGLGLAAGLFILTLDRAAAAAVALGVGHMAVVAVASWRFRPAGQWAAVAAAAVGWSMAELYAAASAPDELALGLTGQFWWTVGLRLGVLASLAATVSAFRRAARRLLRTENALTTSLLRERDSARRDRLTRLWNARYLQEALEHEIARCRRYGRPFGLLVLDLDGFKAVNDSGGHAAGDAVLQLVGRVIRDNCRRTDIPARLGGDEFAVILPEASSLTVPRYAGKLVQLIAAAPQPAGLPRVTASVGGVAFTRAPASAKAALATADEAMYAAKREGKNRAAVRAVSAP